MNLVCDEPLGEGIGHDIDGGVAYVEGSLSSL